MLSNLIQKFIANRLFAWIGGKINNKKTVLGLLGGLFWLCNAILRAAMPQLGLPDPWSPSMKGLLDGAVGIFAVGLTHKVIKIQKAVEASSVGANNHSPLPPAGNVTGTGGPEAVSPK